MNDTQKLREALQLDAFAMHEELAMHKIAMLSTARA
jgi:hypothetical protein